MAYYHPRTGIDTTPSVDYARVLESTSRDVRRLLSAEESAPIMPESVTTLHDLLFKVLLNPDIPVSQILSLRASATTRSLPPQTFEGMWKIVFALGLVPGYESVQLYRGKVEEAIHPVPRADVLRILADPKLGNIKTSSLGGASDITLSLHETHESSGCGPATPSAAKEMFLFCSSKFYIADEKKTVDAYDVANIIAAANHAGYTDDKFRIVLLVKNKDIVKGKFASAYRRYLTYIVQPDGVRDGILGRDDLEAAVVRLRERVGVRSDPDAFVQSVILGKKAPRFLSLRFHQELIVRKTLEIYASGNHSSVLWGVVARGGKTYMCGGLIRDILPHPKYVFIVAGAYTETHSQFLDDLLDVRKNGFQDFDEYTAVNVRDEDFKFDPAKKYIFFISAELLKAFVEGTTGKKARERTVMSLVQSRTIVPEVVFFDEVHKGGTTSLADDAMSLIAGDAFKVFMTATYNKLFIKDQYGITQENFLTWGYEDIQLAKGMDSAEPVEAFGKKYGAELCQAVLASQLARGVSASDIARQYQAFPELQFLTTTFSEAFRESMQKQNILDPTAGFRMNTLLMTGDKCMDTPIKTRYRCFTNPASVAVLLNYIAPHTVQLEAVDGSRVMSSANPNESILTRIGRTSQRRDDILKNVHTEFRPHSQLWFLPQPSVSADDTPLLSRMTALASLLMIHPWFSKHMWVVAVSSGFGRTETTLTEGGGCIVTTNGGSNTKEIILKLEADAREKSRGLIILAGKMLTLGVSLPCVNVVALLDDSQSSDLTYQKMFRALTESEGKRIGYIVDVNPVRTLKTLYDYTKVEHDASDILDDRVDATVLTNLYLIDEDQLFAIDTKTRIGPAELNKAIETYLMSGRKSYRSIVDEAAVKLESIDLQAELAALQNDLHAVKSEAIGVASRLATVPSGLEVIPAEPAKKPVKKDRDETKEKLLALREMILTTMTLLAFLTTTASFQEAIEYYRADTDNIQDIVHSVLVDRGLTTPFAKDRVRATLLTAIGKVQAQLANPYGKMRAKLSELSSDQRDVIEFIQQNLRPKKEQVAARGEVFTPLSLVEEMLAQLPEEVWTHPEYKWLDPANGIGNFPVIAFAKLDAGLQGVPGYEDEAVRRKHIVENMLYMVELDDTNLRLSGSLLEKMCGQKDCRFNLLKHDFTKATDEVLLTAFKVNRFDVIMGNPPYNAGGVAKGGGTIWPIFVRRAFELVRPNGYITFVHPQGWRKPYDATDRESQGKLWYTIRQNGWSVPYINLDDRPRFASTPVTTDYYLIHAGKGETTRYSSRYMNVARQGETTLPFSFIPNLVDPVSTSIVRKLLEAKGVKLSVVYNQSFKPAAKDKDNEGVPHYHFTARTGARELYNKTYTEVPEYISQPKVIMQSTMGYEKGRLFAFYEPTPMGTTNHSMYMLADAEVGPKLAEFLNSDIVTFLMKLTQFSMESHRTNEYKILNQLHMPSSMDVYALTPEELSLIQQIVHPEAKPQATTLRNRKKSPQTTLRNKTTVK